MKIVRLEAENVKRLTAVQITPEGALVTVGGKNGAGKSSVLDAIAYVLGGEKLVPAEPIRQGESEARIFVDLGDYRVTREFKRDPRGIDGNEGWGDVRSTLKVTTPDGAKYSSPQTILDKLYGKLTFDPLGFKNEKPEKQNEILRRVVGLDFTDLNVQRKAAYEARALHRQSHTLAINKLTGMKKHLNAPKELIPITDISEEIKRGDELRLVAEESVRVLESCRKGGQDLAVKMSQFKERIDDLERQLREARESLASYEESFAANGERYKALDAARNAAVAAVPDFGALDKRLADIDQTNTQVRDNEAYAAQEAECERIGALFTEQDTKIATIAGTKEGMLQSAKFPVPGLGLSDTGVTFEGLPLDQVSSSVQLHISIAIGLALNPTLKVLLIRNGNLLDEDNMKVVAQQAEEAGAQVWMEYVTSSKEGMAVMLEDGHLAE